MALHRRFTERCVYPVRSLVSHLPVARDWSPVSMKSRSSWRPLSRSNDSTLRRPLDEREHPNVGLRHHDLHNRLLHTARSTLLIVASLPQTRPE